MRIPRMLKWLASLLCLTLTGPVTGSDTQGPSPRELLAALREECARPEARSVAAGPTRLTELNEAIGAEVKSGNHTMVKMIQEEILAWNGDTANHGRLLCVIFLIQDLAQAEAIIPFARKVLRSPTVPLIVKEQVLREVGVNPRKLFSKPDRFSVVEIAARDENRHLHRQGIRYLLGFRIGKSMVAEGLDPEKGKAYLRRYATREGWSFDGRRWYLHQLAKLGEGPEEQRMSLAQVRKLGRRTVQCCLIQCALAAGLGLAQQSTRPARLAARPPGEDWLDENPAAITRFVELKQREFSRNEKGDIGEKPRMAVRQELIDGWSRFVDDFPNSKLRVHACWRLGGHFSVYAVDKEKDSAKASQYYRQAFELYPDLISIETMNSRLSYASCSLDDTVRASRGAELYRWLRTKAPEIIEHHPPKINGYGYYIPQIPALYGGGQGNIRGRNPEAAAKAFLCKCVDRRTRVVETNLVASAKHPDPNIGWTILDRVGDLLPEDAQAKIAEVAGSRGPGVRDAEPTVESLAAEAHFDAAKTVLDPAMAEGLGNPDAFLPATEPVTGSGVYPAMRDSSRWIRRVLRKHWWPKRDRPKDYTALRSPCGYDSVYRHWRADGTSFMAQSTHGWLEVSLRGTTDRTEDPKLDRRVVERRLCRAARSYISDPRKVLVDAAFEFKPAPCGYEARLRLDAKLVRKLDEADRDGDLEWLRGLRVHTNGTSFVFRFGPKTAPDGQIREARKRWFTGPAADGQADSPQRKTHP